MKSLGRSVIPVLLLVAPLCATPTFAQESLTVHREDGTGATFPIERHDGHAVVSDEVLTSLGWAVEFGSGRVRASKEGQAITMRLESPFFDWNGELLQFVREPFSDTRAVWLPLQLFLDFLPARMPERYGAKDTELRVLGAGVSTLTQGFASHDPDFVPGSADAAESGDGASAPVTGTESRPESGSKASEATTPAVAPRYGVVIIDPGHGGKDPGAVGPGGRREKDVALSVGRALARELSRREGLEVRLTRDRDEFVPLWERGKIATEWKGDLPALFISIHANSLPSKTSVRGFETYFLSEARTEHEARVAANENAPLAFDEEAGGPSGAVPDLDFILRELRNRDHMRWSSVLAEEVQRGMEDVHPGPNRGVKQAPFAVITNALMPAVLVEVGFLTNANEERLLSRGEFQRELAGSMAAAVDRFFSRYPPGGEVTGGGPP